jgi:hypothetical protein
VADGAEAVSVLLSVGRAEPLDKSVAVKLAESLPEPSVKEVGAERELENTAVAPSVSLTIAEAREADPFIDAEGNATEAEDVTDAEADPTAGISEADNNVAEAGEAADRRLNAS